MSDLGLDSDINTILTFVSNDNQTFEIEEKYCNISDYIQSIIDLDKDKRVININTSSELLQIIVSFLNYYPTQRFNRIQKPVPKNFHNSLFINDDIEEAFKAKFYTELLDKDIDLMKLVYIVNYLGIKPMLELVCAKIASYIRDMSKEQEMKFLNISEEDYIEMKKTNDWIKEI